MPTPDEVRDAIEQRVLGNPKLRAQLDRALTRDPADRVTRRKAVTRSATFDHDGALVSTPTYSAANALRGEPLGASYTQVSVKLPDPWGDDIAEAIADGVAPTISGVAREWMNVGRAQWRESKTTNTTEGNTTT